MVRLSAADLPTVVQDAIDRHPAVRTSTLVGSRARGDAIPLSDWDFKIEVADFEIVAAALPELVAPLEPLAAQWDRLSDTACYMLMLSGPAKVDLIFDEPHLHEPPWEATDTTLKGIDTHFWDWILWLAAKDSAGKHELVETELEKLHAHLLGPLGVPRRPASIKEAVASYREAREGAEGRFVVVCGRDLEDEVVVGLIRNGYRL